MENKLPTKNDVREVPKNDVIEAIVIDIQVKTWKELISKDKIDKFDNPEEEQIIVKYDAKGFIREEKFKNEANPTTTSKTGRYLVRYEEFKIGQKVKVDFDNEGKSTILLAK